jgi:hypothetical protein
MKDEPQRVHEFDPNSKAFKDELQKIRDAKLDLPPKN